MFLCKVLFACFLVKKSWFWTPQPQGCEKLQSKNKWILEPPNLKAGGELKQKQMYCLTPKIKDEKKFKQTQMGFETSNLKAGKNLNQQQLGFGNPQSQS